MYDSVVKEVCGQISKSPACHIKEIREYSVGKCEKKKKKPKLKLKLISREDQTDILD